MHTKNNLENLKPFVKWVGGKGSSVERLLKLMPEHVTTYVEPFIGSGAMFFSVNFDKALINDANTELMLTYEVIRDRVFELEMYLSSLIYDKNLYETIRNWDREKDFLQKDKVERAARLIYLMKTCFNGLYRVNKKGFFNTPFGRYNQVQICDSKTLNAVSSYLNAKKVEIFNDDYEKLLDKIEKGSFVYLDPPYFPVSKTANFTSYQSGKFCNSEQVRLRNFCVKLHEKGVLFMLSNSDVEEAHELYKGFNIHVLEVLRKINSNTAKRNAVNELAITNYDSDTGKLIDGHFEQIQLGYR